jgi:hypothetical protein
VNLGTFVALILIWAPVCGFRPIRAFRLLTLNVPNPVRASLLPFFKAAETASVNALSDISALPFGMPAFFAMNATNSAFVISFPPVV